MAGNGNWYSRNAVLNLRFFSRTICFFSTMALAVVVLFDVAHKAEDQTELNVYPLFYYGGKECRAYRSTVSTPSEMWQFLAKVLLAILAFWQTWRVFLVMLPLLRGDVLYRHQEKFVHYRTKVLTLTGTTFAVAIVPSVMDCFSVPGYCVAILSALALFCMFLDRFYVQERDYYKIDIGDDISLLAIDEWDEAEKQKTKAKTNYFCGLLQKSEPSDGGSDQKVHKAAIQEKSAA